MTESDMTGSKLVFIDIDGTLADENHIVPESAKTACARAQANGHKLFICTGRSVPKIERNILDLGFAISCCSSTSYRPKPSMR